MERYEIARKIKYDEWTASSAHQATDDLLGDNGLGRAQPRQRLEAPRTGLAVESRIAARAVLLLKGFARSSTASSQPTLRFAITH